jgi:hypothetical protein
MHNTIKSNAYEAFYIAMQDVEEIIEIYDIVNRDHPDKQPEALKRSALVMAMTVWETYVEDRFKELVGSYLMGVKGSPVYQYIDGKVSNDLRYFHTPNSRNIKKLFEPILDRDVTLDWHWDNFDSKRAREKLNEYISLRGDVVHRSVTDKQNGHPVKKDELQKCVRFLKSLTNAMEAGLSC